MINKKMFMWMGAGLLSAVTIPAIGATLSHHHKRAHAKLVSHPTHLVTAKPASHFSKPTLLVAAHSTKKHVKTAKHSKLAIKPAVGVLAMHSGRSTTTGFNSHLLAATTKVKTNR